MTSNDPQPPPRKSHRLRNITLSVIGGFIVLIVVAAALGGSHPKPAATAATATTAPPAAASSTTPPPPVASPNAKYQGSCDYTLGSDPVGGTAVFVGEIDLDNTGNIGVTVRTRITWPQEGYASITMRRTVRAPAGQTKAVRFHYHASSNQVDLLQAWQTGHGYADGCTYHATITGTFGSAH